MTLRVSESLMKEHERALSRNEYIIVQHLKHDTVLFIRGLRAVGCKIRKVLAVDYSADPVAMALAKQEEMPVSVGQFSSIPRLIAEEVASYEGSSLVILDVGGYAAGIISDPLLSEKLRFVVEDTNNGLWQYEDIMRLRPLVQVANIPNKAVENAYVGRKIIDGCEAFFAENSSQMPKNGVVVMGFGGIGENVSFALHARGVEPGIVEINGRKCAIAAARGHQVGLSISYFPEVRMIIGCTGRASVSPEDLRSANELLFLISGSSKKIEFSRVIDAGRFVPHANFRNALVDERAGIVLVNQGEPINLHYGSLDMQLSDFMFANIVAAIVDGNTKMENNIYQLSTEWQDAICQSWYRAYSERGKMERV